MRIFCISMTWIILSFSHSLTHIYSTRSQIKGLLMTKEEFSFNFILNGIDGSPSRAAVDVTPHAKCFSFIIFEWKKRKRDEMQRCCDFSRQEIRLAHTHTLQWGEKKRSIELILWNVWKSGKMGVSKIYTII